ncbi:MAG: hypothetical protein R2848_15890 [Thermomicrobiales bacterium]
MMRLSERFADHAMHANIRVGVGVALFGTCAHGVEVGENLVAILIRELLDRIADCGDLEQTACLSEILHGERLDQEIRGHLAEIGLDIESPHESANALACLDQTDRFHAAERLTYQRAADAHLGREPSFGG